VTVREALERLDPAQDALIGMTGPTVTVADVLRHAELAASTLQATGAASAGPVVVAMPPGVAQATALLALLAAGVTVVPLDTRSRSAEAAFVLEDSAAVAVLTTPGSMPELEALAVSRDLAVIEAGDGPSAVSWSVGRRRAPGPAGGWDAALLLHTSGTTSTPKLVGLRSDQLVSSAGVVASTLRLDGEDRGLVVMPLFHIHGIVAGLLAPVLAGGSVVLPGAFDAFTVERSARQHGATWLTAVPSAHRAVLRVARGRGDAYTGFRLLRSSSSPLDVGLAAALSERFGCPVLNSYGMTEATHQMASQRLDDEGVAWGEDVGRAAGSELALLVDGAVVVEPQPTVEGEVLVRGPHVIDRYLAPEGASGSAFVEGWLRTGDLGQVQDGRLRLLGRLKEMINVAGEKVSPFEVEDALRSCPGVADLAAFAVPDDAHGERVNLVVVAGAGLDVEALRRSARERLAPYKVPARVVVVDAIPLGPTGKVQRSRLPEQLGLLEPGPG
jgi:acyl-CoA synthetase (AMP-forming)/AMP-acid ligase II